MATKECSSCAMEVDTAVETCPICGYEFPQQKSSIKWIALAMLILFAYPLIRLISRFLSNL